MRKQNDNRNKAFDDHKFFSKILQNSSNLIIVFESNLCFKYVSSSVKTVLGYESENAIIGKSAEELIHPKDLVSVKETVLRLENIPEDSKRIVLRFKHLNGSWKTFESVGWNLLKDEDIQGIVFNMHEIPGIDQTCELSYLQNQALKNLSSGIVITDYLQPDNPIIFSNPAFTKLTGYHEEEVIGRNCRFLQGKETDKEETRRLKKSIESEKECSVTLLNYRKDGKSFWNELKVTPIKNKRGITTHFIGVLDDVTEKKATLNRLKQTSEFAYKILESIPQLAWIADPEGTPVYYNERWVDFLGIPLEKIIETSIRRFIHPNDHMLMFENWGKSKKTGRMFEYEYRMRNVHGEYRWFLGRAIPMKEEDGEIFQWIGTATDIHEKKLKEERTKFLDKASKILSSSIDYETTLRSVAQLAVPQIADWCSIELIKKDDTLENLVIYHKDKKQVAWAREIREKFLDTGYVKSPSRQAIDTKKPVFYPLITEEMIRSFVKDEKILKIILAIGFTSLMTIPLIERKKVLGTITFVSSDSKRRFNEHDLHLVLDLAERAAAAVDNSLLYHEAKEEIFKRKKMEKELNRLNEELEKRVTERTKQLDELNLKLRKQVEETMLAQEVLRQSEQRLSLHFEQTPLAFIEWNTNFEVVDWNPAAEKIFGYSEKEVIGMHAYDLILPFDQRKNLPKVWRNLIRNRESQNTINENVTKDGKRITCTWYNTPLENRNNEIIGIASLVLDITEQVQVENALKDSEEKYKAVVSALEEGVILQDFQGNLLTMNKSAEKMLGFSMEEIEERGYISFVQNIIQKNGQPYKLEEYPGAVALMTGRTVRNKIMGFYRSDGKLLWLSVSSNPIFKDSTKKPYAAVTSIIDITEQTEAEDALRDSEEKYKAVVSSLEEGILLQDTEGKILTMNVSAENILGKKLKEIQETGYNDSLLKTITEDGLPFLPNDYPGRKAIISGKPVLNTIMGLTFKDEVKWVRINAAPIFRNKETKPYAVVSSFDDITYDKKYSKELLNLNKRLEQSNNELQDFASVASHDLQEPLRKVQAFGDRLRTKYSKNLGEEGLDYLTRMQNASNRMQALINDLLEFSRVTTRAQPFVKVNLNTLLKEVIEDLEVRIEETDATIETKKLPVIEADPMQMRQLFQNILSNALKFISDGKHPVIKIYSKTLISDKTKSGTTLKKYYRIYIEDNGIGFDEKYLDRIFNVFQRLHARTEYAGTGVGLAVCRKIVERHNGKITAKSIPGKGATFIIMLPIKQNEHESK